MKKWYRSKTIQIAIIQAVLGSLIMVIESGAPWELGLVLVVKSIADVMMRLVTDKQVML